MDGQPLYPDGAQRIMNLIKATFGTMFKAYFIGATADIPQDAYPCVVVQKATGTYRVGPTQTDEFEEVIYVHVMVNEKDGFGSPESDDTVMRQLFNLIEGRDAATGALQPTTMMYALRKNLTLNSPTASSNITINNDVHITYDLVANQEIPALAEAVIEVTITEREVIGARR